MSVPYSDRDGSEPPKTLEGNEPETTQSASGSPSNPTDSSDVLRRVTEERTQRYADAIYTTHRAAVGVLRADLIARTVMAVADAEMVALRAEVEDWKAEVQRVDSERSAALVATSKDLTRVIDRARAAEAERDRLAAIIEQVRAALIEEQRARCAYGTRHGDGMPCDCKFRSGRASSEATGCPELRAILAILDGAQTPQTTPQTRDVAAGAPGSVSGGTETGEALGEERCCEHRKCPGGSLCCCTEGSRP